MEEAKLFAEAVSAAKERSDHFTYYALKVMQAQTASHLRSLEKEAVLLDRFQGPDSKVVRMYDSDVCHDEGKVRMVLELAQRDFRALMDDLERPFDFAEICHHWKQMVDVVATLHRSDTVHFDLKPDNFLVFEDGQVIKLSDFGLAATVREGHTHISRQGAAGTLRYMAPETIYQAKEKG